MSPALRNPKLSWRVLLVAAVFAAPGGLGGAMTSFWFGDFAACSVIGALIGALCGGLMEAWQPDTHDSTVLDDHRMEIDQFTDEQRYLVSIENK